MSTTETSRSWIVRLAYHEAGHAVVARLLRQKVYYVWCCPKAGGTCYHEVAGLAHRTLDHVTVTAAGDAAESVAEQLPDWPMLCRPTDRVPRLAMRLAKEAASTPENPLDLFSPSAMRKEVETHEAGTDGALCDYLLIARMTAEQRAAGIGPASVNEWYRVGRDRAERMLAEHLPLLRSVAEALMREGWLDEKRLATIAGFQ